MTPPRDINEETLTKIRQITSAIAKEKQKSKYYILTLPIPFFKIDYIWHKMLKMAEKYNHSLKMWLLNNIS